MKKLFSAIMVLTLIATMVFGFGINVHAADMNGSGVIETTDNTITFKKEIVFINNDGADVYEPNITYTYTIEPATPNEIAATAAARTTITDVDNDTATVQAGKAAGVTLDASGVVFSATNDVVAGVESTGTKSVTRTFSVTVDPTQFAGKAGIYRYKITEVVDADALQKVGITRSTDYDNVRYLDVYLKNNQAGTALEVYGYVLFDGTDTDSFDATSETPATPDLIAKTEGFVRDDDVELSIANVDVYYTYNLKLTKNIEGELSDKTHKFPFIIDLANVDNAAAYQYFDQSHPSTGTKKLFSDGTIAQSLGHNEYVEIKGLPATAKLNITETNDTYDVYKVKIDDSIANAVQAEAQVDRNGKFAMVDGTTASESATKLSVTNYSTYAVAGAASATQQYKNVLFTNTLEVVSPTGVVLRILPYVLMLGAGIMVIVALRRMREKSLYAIR